MTDQRPTRLDDERARRAFRALQRGTAARDVVATHGNEQGALFDDDEGRPAAPVVPIDVAGGRGRRR